MKDSYQGSCSVPPRLKRNTVNNDSMTPPLKWAGGKRWLAPTINNYWQAHKQKRFVELFCGGLAISLSLQPEKALLNDANPHLINFYLWVKKGLRLTIEARNDEPLYYASRDRFNQLIRKKKEHTREAAQLFYYLNRTCFNGLCRFNLSGEFNVPFGSYSDGLKYLTDFMPYMKTFESWNFSNFDFESTPIKRGDFIYADPPYDVGFTTYSKGGFSWEDQERVAEWLARHRGPVILSNHATERIVRLYKKLGFKLNYHDAPRRISCNGNRTSVVEVLAVKGL
jgi:DNA adenine methylase